MIFDVMRFETSFRYLDGLPISECVCKHFQKSFTSKNKPTPIPKQILHPLKMSVFFEFPRVCKQFQKFFTSKNKSTPISKQILHHLKSSVFSDFWLHKCLGCHCRNLYVWICGPPLRFRRTLLRGTQVSLIDHVIIKNMDQIRVWVCFSMFECVPVCLSLFQYVLVCVCM